MCRGRIALVDDGGNAVKLKESGEQKARRACTDNNDRIPGHIRRPDCECAWRTWCRSVILYIAKKRARLTKAEGQ